MKVLVTGVNGQLGYDVVRELMERGIPCRGVDIDDFDLTKKDEVTQYIKTYAPDAVIHCAAYTAVDRAEDEPEKCYEINVEGTRNLFKAAQSCNAKFMYMSTDYIFGGYGNNPFETDEAPLPLNVYGRTKWQGEQVVADYEKKFIVRISWVFGKNGGNFVRTMLKLAGARDEISVVSDQVGSPTYTYDLSKLLCDMIVTEKYGVYHATNEGYCSWNEFARYIFTCAGLQVKVNEILTKDYPAKAVRGKNSRLNKRSLDLAGFDRLPDWKDATKRFVKELLKD